MATSSWSPVRPVDMGLFDTEVELTLLMPEALSKKIARRGQLCRSMAVTAGMQRVRLPGEKLKLLRKFLVGRPTVWLPVVDHARRDGKVALKDCWQILPHYGIKLIFELGIRRRPLPLRVDDCVERLACFQYGDVSLSWKSVLVPLSV